MLAELALHGAGSIVAKESNVWGVVIRVSVLGLIRFRQRCGWRVPRWPRFDSKLHGLSGQWGPGAGFLGRRCGLVRLGSPRRDSAPRRSALPMSLAFASGRQAGCRFSRARVLGACRIDSRGVRSVALQGLVESEHDSSGVRDRRESGGVSRWAPSPALGLVEFEKSRRSSLTSR